MRNVKEIEEIGRQVFTGLNAEQKEEVGLTLYTSLTGREYHVMSELFGLSGEDPKQVGTLAVENCVTEERMIQIIEKALRRMKSRNILTSYI